MSSRSSCSETLSDAPSLPASSCRPARPASIRMLARVTRRANRSGRIAESGGAGSAGSGSRSGRAPWGIEVGRPLEIVLGLGGVAHLAPDPGQAEHPDGIALVGAADQVELIALVEELVGVDLARAHVVALHRVVVEHDRLAPEDRRLDLGQALGDVMAAGRAGDS